MTVGNFIRQQLRKKNSVILTLIIYYKRQSLRTLRCENDEEARSGRGVQAGMERRRNEAEFGTRLIVTHIELRADQPARGLSLTCRLATEYAAGPLEDAGSKNTGTPAR